MLGLLGTTRRSARSAYVRELKGADTLEWIGEEPGRLPWWRLGRPPAGDDYDPEAAVRAKRDRTLVGPGSRSPLTAAELLDRGARRCAGDRELQLEIERLLHALSDSGGMA